MFTGENYDHLREFGGFNIHGVTHNGGVPYNGGDYRGATAASTAGNSAAVQAALDEVAGLMCSRHLTQEEAATSDKSLRFFMGYDGNGVMRKDSIIGNEVTIIAKADKVPGARKVEESIDIVISEKLPKHLLRTLMAAFKAVYDRDKTESAAQIYRDRETKEYMIYYPEQENSGAASNYGKDKRATEELRTTMDFVLEAHSHAGFGAFFSGTDNANENLLLYYIVLGNFGAQKCSFVSRIKAGALSKAVTISDIFADATEEDLVLKELPTEFGDILTKASAVKATYTAPYRHLGYAAGQQFQPLQRDENGRFLPYAGPAVPGSFSQPSGKHKLGKKHRMALQRQQALMESESRKPRIDSKWLVALLSNEEAVELRDMLNVRLS